MAEQDQNQPEENTSEGEEKLETQDSQPESGEAAADIVEEPAELTDQERILQLEDELIGAKDDVLRAQAEAQNAGRRAEQDIEKARKFALERFTGELLPVVDNLERALEAAVAEDASVKSIAEGVELTLKSFQDVMVKFKVEVVDPQGEPFDPNVHQAMSMVENNDVEPNTVIAVMQKGYTLNGRLVRPAMVMVSKSGS